MSESPSQRTRRALRFVMVPIVITGLGLVGIVLRTATDEVPATTAEKRAVLDKIQCRDDLCYGALEAPASQCAALATCDGCDPDADTEFCPGDPGYVAPGAAKRLRRLLHCARVNGALQAWHADPVLPGTACLVSLVWTRSEARAWAERLDAATSTGMLDYDTGSLPAQHKRGAGRANTWAGASPTDDTNDLADGGVLDGVALDPVDAG